MDRSSELYRSVGEAMHLAQTLELNITILLSIIKLQVGVDIDQKKLILNEDKKTLGLLIKELKRDGNLDEAGCDALKEALERRNYIAHHFFNRNVDAFSEQAAYDSAMTKLNESSKAICLATAITQGFVEGFFDHYKIALSNLLIRQDI